MLTIGIPTYNRVVTISEHLERLIAASVHQVAQVLIIDNASPDDTFKRLKEICDGTPIRVLRNPKNLGWKGNLVRLFEECRTEYLLVTSDEDVVIPAHLSDLAQFLQAHKPLFVSPQYYLGEQPARLYRGQLKSRQILPHEFRRCSAHGNSLVYRTRESIELLADIKAHHEKEELNVYLLMLLAAGLILRGPCWWWDKPITGQQYFLPQSHDVFYHVPQRWEQYKAFVDFFKDRIEKGSDPATKKMAEEMLQAQHETLIPSLRYAVSLERPDLLSHFDRGVRALYLKRSIVGKCVRLARHPKTNGRLLLRHLRRCRGS